MQLLFKQRFFSWLDSYDIYDGNDQKVFQVEGKLDWGHRLHILDAAGVHIGTLKEVVLTFLPKFEIYVGNRYAGSIRKALTLLNPRYEMDLNGWEIKGNWLEWDYQILDRSGRCVATISKQVLNWTDTYVIDIEDPEDALCALMVVLAIDAEKCSRG